MLLVTWPCMCTPSLGWHCPTRTCTYRAEVSPASNVNGVSGRDGDGIGENILTGWKGGGGPDSWTPPVSAPAFLTETRDEKRGERIALYEIRENANC